MTDTDHDPATRDDRPPVIDRHQPPAEPRQTGPLGAIEGTDHAALGLDADVTSAPSAAQVDASETGVPGPEWGEHPNTDRKPWETSLATESDDAGIGVAPDPEGEA